MKMFTLGHDFMPPGIHAGGLRYHGASPLVSQLYHEGLIEAIAVPQLATFDAGAMRLPMPKESSPLPNPAMPSAVRLTKRCVARKSAKPNHPVQSDRAWTLDMGSYDRYFVGELEDFSYPDEAIRASLQHLPKFG